MSNKDRTTYKREYNKEVYKTVKVYVREEEYPEIIEHMKNQGYTKLSGYIKDLIKKDMGGVKWPRPKFGTIPAVMRQAGALPT